MNKKQIFGASALACVVIGALALTVGRQWINFSGSVRQINIDLMQPDAWIRTESLAQLPRDVLKLPIARDVLTEDLLFYYEQHEDKLGLRGSLRRLSYEHNLQWQDKLLEIALDEPAELALWRDARGSLRHYLLAMTRNQLAKIMQQAATVAASDAQLSLLAETRIAGDKVQILVFKIGAERSFVFAARGNRVVVFSDPGMVADGEKNITSNAKQVLEKLLSGDAREQAIYADFFISPANKEKHSLVVRSEFLSFGYQHFFPGMEALRFDFSAQGAWSSQGLFDGKRLAAGSLQDAAIWNAMPMDPAACALLPVDWTRGQEIVAKIPKADTLLAQLDGPAAICWYAQSQLHTPLIVAHLKAGSQPDSAALQGIYQWAVRGAQEAKASNNKGAQLWKTAVDAPFAPGKRGEASYQVSLAQQGEFVLFSPDGKLVEQGLASIGRRYPNMRDVLPKGAQTLGVFVPNKLARMLQTETQEVLARPGEEVFQAAAKEHLWPKLEALKKYPAYRLSLNKATPREGAQWLPLQWQVLTNKAGQ